MFLFNLSVVSWEHFLLFFIAIIKDIEEINIQYESSYIIKPISKKMN